MTDPTDPLADLDPEHRAAIADLLDADPGNPDPLHRIATALESIAKTLRGIEWSLDSLDLPGGSR